MTKTFNKENIIPIKGGGYVVVDKEATIPPDTLKYCSNTHTVLSSHDATERFICKDCSKVIASIGKRIEGVPLIEEVDELEELISELPIDWMGTGSVKSAEAEEKAWTKKWNAYKAAQSKGQYSEEDMILYSNWLTQWLFTNKYRKLIDGAKPYGIGDFISDEELFAKWKSLQPKRIPISVELEMQGYTADYREIFNPNSTSKEIIWLVKITSPETNTIIPINIEYE